MTKVEFFFGGQMQVMEEQVNSFIKEVEGSGHEIISCNLSLSNDSEDGADFCACVTYRKKRMNKDPNMGEIIMGES